MAVVGPLIVLQSICTIWTKASRGGVGALARNQTPEGLELPPYRPPAATEAMFLIYEVVYGEHNGFQQPQERRKQHTFAEPCWYNCLRLSRSEKTLDVILEWERNEGAPRRPAFPRTAWSLEQEQWVRLVYNLRNSEEAGWVYKKYVISIGFLQVYAPEVFLETRPTHRYDAMAQLW